MHFDSYSMPSVFSVNHKMQTFFFQFLHIIFACMVYAHVCTCMAYVYWVQNASQNQKIMLTNFLYLMFLETRSLVEPPGSVCLCPCYARIT